MSYRNQLKSCAKLVARDIKAGKYPTHSTRAAEIVEQEPTAVLHVIGLIRSEAARKQPDDAVITAYGLMLHHGLGLLRDQADCGYGWAEEMIDDARQAVLAFAEGEAVSPGLLLMLVNSFVEADIAPGDELTEAFGEIAVEFEEIVAEEEQTHSPLGSAEVDGMFEALVEEAGGDEFQIHSSIATATQAMPPRFRQVLLTEIATHDNPVLRDTAVLCVLDPAAEVRRTLYRALADNASRSLLSPVALRRTIAMRNWLPESERPELDTAIKKARQKQADCAPWPKRDIEDVFVSNIDGVGAQSVFAIVKDGRKRVFANLLVKRSVGIADAWCLGDQSKADTNRLLNTVRSEAEIIAVRTDFLRVLGSHHLAVGQRAGNLPDASLLEFLETIGMEGWQPRELRVDDLIALLEPLANPARLDKAAVGDILKNSGDWFYEFSFLDSWFEYDAKVEEVLTKNPSSSARAKIRAVTKSILEPRRGKWAELLLWTAFWMKEEPDLLAQWEGFFIVGREVHRGRPLADIPFMKGIAEATVAASMMDGD